MPFDSSIISPQDFVYKYAGMPYAKCTVINFNSTYVVAYLRKKMNSFVLSHNFCAKRDSSSMVVLWDEQETVKFVLSRKLVTEEAMKSFPLMRTVSTKVMAKKMETAKNSTIFRQFVKEEFTITRRTFCKKKYSISHGFTAFTLSKTVLGRARTHF